MYVVSHEETGGGKRIRTADLPRAKRTLYQLSYAPIHVKEFLIIFKSDCGFISSIEKMVGLSRLERLTSPLSAECSNQLSYRPAPNFDTQRALLFKSDKKEII